MKSFILVALIFIFSSCSVQPCEDLQEHFSSYNEVLNKIERAKFNLVDKANTSKSSWVTNARFYSCNKQEGYLIPETAKKITFFKGYQLIFGRTLKLLPHLEAITTNSSEAGTDL